MRKRIVTMLTSVCAAACLAFSVLSLQPITASAATWTPTVEGGVLDDLVPLGHEGGNNGSVSDFGSKLIEDSSMGENRGWYEIQVGGNWGSRYTFDYEVDIRDITLTLDLNNMNTESELGFIFGAGKGNYFNAEYGGFGLKICAHGTQFGIVVSNVAHQISIESITPAPAALPWNSMNSGFVVDAADKILDISFKQKTEGGDITLNLEGAEYNIPLGEATKILGNDLGKVNLMTGALGGTKEIYRVKMEDANSKVYESQVGACVDSVKAYVAAADGDLSTGEKILAAELLGMTAATDEMRNYDLAYWSEKLTAAEEKIAAARAALSVEEKITVFESDVVLFNQMIAATTDNATLAAADALSAYIQKNDVEALENTTLGDNQAAFSEASADFDTAKAALEEARKTVVLNYLSQYEEKAAAVQSVKDVKFLAEAKELIYENLPKLDTATKGDVALRIVASQEETDRLSEMNGWLKSENTVAYTDGKAFEILADSAYNHLDGERKGSTVTYGEKVKVNKFSISLRITEHSMALFENWIGISLTKNNDNFIYNMDATNDAQVEEFQSNPGIAITLEQRAGNKLYVELFMIKRTHTSIYGASRGQMLIDYKIGDPLNIEIVASDDVNSSYAKMTINGVEFTGTNIKNSEIKAALGGFEGYLSFAFANAGSEIRVEKINGAEALTPNASSVGTVTPSEGEENKPADPDNSASTDNSSGSEGKKSGCGSMIGVQAAMIGAMLAAGVALVVKKRKMED